MPGQATVTSDMIKMNQPPVLDEIKLIDPAVNPGYPDFSFQNIFGPVLLPRIYGKDLTGIEIGSSGKVLITINDINTFDFSNADGDWTDPAFSGDKITYLKARSSNYFNIAPADAAKTTVLGNFKTYDDANYQALATDDVEGFKLMNKMKFTEDVYMAKKLGVSGAVTLHNNLGVSGSAQIKKNLGVSGYAYVKETLGVSGAVTLHNNLGVSGSAQIKKNLGVSGYAYVKQTLGVSGAATLYNTLAVKNIASFSNNIDVVLGNKIFADNLWAGYTGLSNLTINASHTTFLGDVIIQGSLDTLDTTHLVVKDKIIFAAGLDSNAPQADGAANNKSGLEIYGDSTQPLIEKSIKWNYGTSGVPGMASANSANDSYWEMLGGQFRMSYKKSLSDIVSYGFRINEKDELEFVKYETNKNPARVAKFGVNYNAAN